MAEIKPFKMVQYNGNCSQDLDKLITPPYDVISSEQQEEFYRAHPNNMIRLVLGKQYETDGVSDNKYTRAAAVLKEWLNTHTLVQSEQPGFMVYQMQFEHPDGGRRTLDGIVALVKVDEYGKGKVLPHEKTYAGPKEDQLNLLRACRAHLTPIHALYDDPEDLVIGDYSQVLDAPADQEAIDANGTVHRTWKLQDPEAVNHIASVLRDKSFFIADGHHRYETSRAYHAEMLDRGNGDAAQGSGYVMMYLTSMTHPGLTILPAHRLVRGLSDFHLPTMMEKLSEYFEIEELSFGEGDCVCVAPTLIDRVSANAEHRGNFGMAVQGEACFRHLKLKDFSRVDPLIDSSIPDALRDLDVTILREIIMGLALDLDRDHPEGRIEYTPSALDGLARVCNGDIQIGFVLNPTRVDQMRAAAELGHKLPQKSTYFFPKLSSGLVMNVF
jgi:uncharacterized protein (DUF1015 family)